MDDLIRDLSRIQDYATGLHSLINTAQDAAPQTATATDGSGMISVTLGPDGLPRTFRVDQNWRRRIEPERFGQVVIEAFQAAMSERLAVWSRTLQDEGWQARFDQLRAGAAKPSEGQVPPAFRRPEPSPNPRSIDVVAEEMIRALDKAPDIAAAKQRTPTGAGSDRSGKLTLTVSGTGLVSCVVEAKWATEQTGTALTNALVEALAAARAQLARADDGTTRGPDLNDLFGEAIALLNDPRRMMEP